MALSPEEKARIAQEHLARLEAREAQKAEREKEDAEDLERRRQEARIRREEEIRRVKAEVEEAFYRERGYMKYVTHRGKVLWLTPEEYRLRKQRRKRDHHRNPWISLLNRHRQTVLYLCVAAAALLMGAYLAR